MVVGLRWAQRLQLRFNDGASAWVRQQGTRPARRSASCAGKSVSTAQACLRAQCDSFPNPAPWAQVKFHLSWSLALTVVFVGAQIVVLAILGNGNYIVQARLHCLLCPALGFNPGAAALLWLLRVQGAEALR